MAIQPTSYGRLTVFVSGTPQSEINKFYDNLSRGELPENSKIVEQSTEIVFSPECEARMQIASNYYHDFESWLVNDFYTGNGSIEELKSKCAEWHQNFLDNGVCGGSLAFEAPKDWTPADYLADAYKVLRQSINGYALHAGSQKARESLGEGEELRYYYDTNLSRMSKEACAALDEVMQEIMQKPQYRQYELKLLDPDTSEGIYYKSYDHFLGVDDDGTQPPANVNVLVKLKTPSWQGDQYIPAVVTTEVGIGSKKYQIFGEDDAKSYLNLSQRLTNFMNDLMEKTLFTDDEKASIAFLKRITFPTHFFFG